jgi:methylthioribose-1-phosphate isomerase
MALSALKSPSGALPKLLEELAGVGETLGATRPTARNLFWAIERMLRVARAATNVSRLKAALVAEAVRIHREQLEADLKLSGLGASLIRDGDTILTHCETGPLATGGYGTALGVIRKAWELGKPIKIIADETRPLLQGARLTCWELKKLGIPFKLITDSMAGYLMGRGQISCVIVGADRIAGNGDTANKIGTYTLAVLAREHDIPFYVAAPVSTLDIAMDRGIDIPVEQRHPSEVTHVKGVAIAPEGTEALNPAFDITPHQLITAIITEKGIIRRPYHEGLRSL